VQRKETAPNTSTKMAAFYGTIDSSEVAGYIHSTVRMHPQRKAGRTRTDKIGVGAGADIGGTGISCNFMAGQYTRPTRQSYRDDHRHVGAMPATPSINRPAFSVSVMRYVRVDVCNSSSLALQIRLTRASLQASQSATRF
jgi:hypothetical protein